MRKLAFAATLLLVGSNCGSGSGSRTVLQNKGSDTLVNVAQTWAEQYKAVNDSLAIAVTGGGSGTGIAAMINGTVDIANSSRKMKDKELELARRNDIEPVEFTVGFDALAVYIHPENPLSEISFAELADIYGEGGQTEKWSQLEIEVPGCSNGEVIRVSRQNNSGTYVYFKEAVLGAGRDYKLGSRDMHGSKDVVDLVSKTPCAIGYSGLAYKTHKVKTPCVQAAADAECIEPSLLTAASRTFPISRPLLMYTRGNPEGAVKEYLDWILSDQGQCIIQARGYAPVRPVNCTE